MQVTRYAVMNTQERRFAEVTKIDGGPIECIYCKFEMHFEADFAKHFILDNIRNKSLGACKVFFPEHQTITS